MPNIDDCLKSAREGMPDFSADELRQYVKDVFTRARSYKDVSAQTAIERAKESVGEEDLAHHFEIAQVTANNLRKFERLSDKIKNESSSLREIVARRGKNQSQNIESAQKAKLNQLADTFFTEISSEDLGYLQNPENELEIASAFDGKKTSKNAQKIASQLHKYIDERTAQIVNANSILLGNIQGDRYLRAIHDPSKMIKRKISRIKSALNSAIGKKTEAIDEKAVWREFIKQQLDIEKTFEYTDAIELGGKLSDKAVDSILDEIYDNITTGKKEIFSKTGVLTDIEAMKKRRNMFFHWKNMQTFTKYNQVYGQGTLFKSLMTDMHSSANRAGMSELFGSSPAQMYEKLKRVKEHPKKGIVWWKTTDWAFQYASGELRTAESPTLATFGSNLRTYSSMARLGGLVLQSLSDSNIAASYVSRWGINYGKAFIGQMDGLLSQFTSDEKKAFANSMHMSLKHQMGYMGKFIDSANISDLTQKVSGKYYRAIGMNAWDNGNRVAAMASISAKLAQESYKSWINIPKTIKNQLISLNFTQDEWDVLRKHNKSKFFSLDNVKSLSSDEIKYLRDKTSPTSNQFEYQSELYRKVHTLLENASDNAILTPGHFQSALMSLGTKPGSISGELVRTLMQFKGFTLTYIDRALAQGWKNADGVSGKSLWALQQFGYILPLSYMSMYFYNAGQGKSMPDFSKLDTAQRISQAAELAMPGFGAMTMILDPQQQNSNMLSSVLTTPSMRFISNVLSVPLSLAESNVEKTKKSAKKAIQYITPGATLPFASPFIKHVLGEKPFLGPGQKILSWAPTK